MQLHQRRGGLGYPGPVAVQLELCQCRGRMVDLWRYRQAHPDLPTPPLVYWGHYVVHDNNRDQIGMTLKLSQNVTDTYFHFHPQVIHDLHESIPFLYISTGTGPYNPALDPNPRIQHLTF